MIPALRPTVRTRSDSAKPLDNRVIGTRSSHFGYSSPTGPKHAPELAHGSQSSGILNR